MGAGEIYATAVSVVAQAERMRIGAVLRPRGRRAQGARRAAAYLAAVAGGAPKRQLYKAVAVSRWMLQRQIAQVEDMRDDAAFDARITDLEERLHARLA